MATASRALRRLWCRCRLPKPSAPPGSNRAPGRYAGPIADRFGVSLSQLGAGTGFLRVSGWRRTPPACGRAHARQHVEPASAEGRRRRGKYRDPDRAGDEIGNGAGGPFGGSNSQAGRGFYGSQAGRQGDPGDPVSFGEDRRGGREKHSAQVSAQAGRPSQGVSVEKSAVPLFHPCVLLVFVGSLRLQSLARAKLFLPALRIAKHKMISGDPLEAIGWMTF